MKTILILLGTALLVHGETLRVSRVADKVGPNVEQMRYTTELGVMVYRVEKERILTNKDVKSARVVPKKKGVIEVTLTGEGAKKLSAATKDADGTLRLAIVVENVLESVPLVMSELKDTFWISGLDDRELEELKELAEAFQKPEKEPEAKADAKAKEGAEAKAKADFEAEGETERKAQGGE